MLEIPQSTLVDVGAHLRRAPVLSRLGSAMSDLFKERARQQVVLKAHLAAPPKHGLMVLFQRKPKPVTVDTVQIGIYRGYGLR